MISFDQLSCGPRAAAAPIVTFPVLLLTTFALRQPPARSKAVEQPAGPSLTGT